MAALNTLQSKLALKCPGGIGQVLHCTWDARPLKTADHFLKACSYSGTSVPHTHISNSIYYSSRYFIFGSITLKDMVAKT